jgi:hypothetical protein
MTSLGILLSSATRTEILRALMYQPEPAGLRPLARIAGVLPHSAELALSALVKEKRVQRTAHVAGPRYALNRRHPDVELLEAVFTAASRAATANRCRMLNRHATCILPFIREAGRMLTRARETRHVA